MCGQLRGYQYGPPDAFGLYNIDPSLKVSEGYAEGVSITYGTAAATKHIWTYAAGLSLKYDVDLRFVCPCNTGSTAVVPPYVGSDYYCETGYNGVGVDQSFFPNDPLWDGQQCVDQEAPCCIHRNMPWFTKSLGETTTEDIQLRLCIGDAMEEILLEVIEFYVQ